jgi:tetratricopeptide (TPR) repeat protein
MFSETFFKNKLYLGILVLGVVLAGAFLLSNDLSANFSALQLLGQTHKNSSPLPTPSPTAEEIEAANQKLLDKDEELLVFYQGNPVHLETAFSDLEEFTKNNPQNPRAKALLGLAYITARQDGSSELDDALAIEPGNVIALRTRINFFIHPRTYDYDSWTEAYDELKKYHPDHPLVNLYKAKLSNRDLNYKNALTLVNKELETKQMTKEDYYFALIIKTFSLSHLNKNDEADAAYQDLIKVSEGPWDYQSYAIFLINNTHDYAKAIETMEAGLKIMDFESGHMTLQHAYQKAGELLYKAGEYEESMKMFDTAVAVYPRDCDCHYLKGIASYYRKYGTKMHDPVYIQKSNEVLDLIKNTQR